VEEAVKGLDEALKRIDERLRKLEEEVAELKSLLLGVCPKCHAVITKKEVRIGEDTLMVYECQKCKYMLGIWVNKLK